MYGGDIQSKRYKMYEINKSTKVPRTTAWRHTKRSNSDAFSDTLEEIPDAEGECFDMDIDDETSETTENLAIETFEQPIEDKPTKAKEIIESVPLYVIKCDSCPDGLSNARISKAEHELAVLAYAARHNLSDTAIEDLLKLLDLHVPESNLISENISSLKERCGFNCEFLRSFTFCNICKNTIKRETESCETPNCTGQKPSVKNKSFFMTGDLKTQLSDVLAKPGLWENIQEKHGQENSVISDITDGAAYRELKKTGNFLNNSNNISLTLFTDGVPLFQSSGVCMWPVYLLINEIPRHQRFSKKNMVLWGVWQGVGKPSMTVFLKELVKDLNELYTTGFEFRVGESVVNCKAMLVIATMDLQARSSVLKMTQFNGEYACVYCMEKGKQVKSGKGHCKVFPFQEQMTSRTSSQIRKDSAQAQTTKTVINGFQGESVLLYLENFELNENIVVDYMHGILLGITKRFMNYWFDKKYSKEQFYIGKSTARVDARLMEITPPHKISRLPRKIAASLNNWKASELRAWLLYYSLPCLQGILGEMYLKHFCLLVEASYILLSEGISEEDIQRAKMLLRTFLKTAVNLYLENVMGLNMHNLSHITKCVEQWGPMWAWSCFSFESFNGEIKKTVHGTGNVCLQIFWALMAQKRIANTCSSIENQSVSDFVECMTSKSFKSNSDTVQPCLVKKTFTIENDLIEQSVVQQIKQITHNEDVFLKKAKKVIVNGLNVYSKQCTKVKKRNSYTVKVIERVDDVKFLEVDYFLVEESSSTVFAVGRQLEFKQSLLPNNAPHLWIAEYCRSGTMVVKAMHIQAILVSFSVNGRRILTLLPNSVEGD